LKKVTQVIIINYKKLQNSLVIKVEKSMRNCGFNDLIVTLRNYKVDFVCL